MSILFNCMLSIAAYLYKHTLCIHIGPVNAKHIKYPDIVCCTNYYMISSSKFFFKISRILASTKPSHS